MRHDAIFEEGNLERNPFARKRGGSQEGNFYKRNILNRKGGKITSGSLANELGVGTLLPKVKSLTPTRSDSLQHRHPLGKIAQKGGGGEEKNGALWALEMEYPREGSSSAEKKKQQLA